MVQADAEPEDFAAQTARAAEAAQRADWPEALRRWEAVRATFPEAPAGYLGLGVALWESDRADEAEDLLTAAVARFPRHRGLAAAHASVASRRQDWPEALRRWDQTLARFATDPDPHWCAARAEALLELGRPDEAAAIFRRLESDPAFFRAKVGLARVAMARRNWEEALACWDRILAGFSSASSPYWRLGRATALLRLGRREEAEAALRGLVQTNPDFLTARLVLIDSLVSRSALEGALAEIATVVSPPLAARKIDILIRQQRLAEAATEFWSALTRAQQPIDFESLLLLIPRLFEGPERRNAWLAFQSQLRGAAAADPRRKARLAPFGLRALLALRDYKGFMRGIDRGEENGAVDGHRELLLSVARTLREADFPDRDKPKVFGIGLSKTGTTSLPRCQFWGLPQFISSIR